MNNNTIGQGIIRIDADTSDAISKLQSLSSSLTSIVPGGNAVANTLQRVSYGFNQIVQGISRSTFLAITDGIRSFIDAGVDMAETLESSAVAFETLLGSAEDAEKLIADIQKNAVTTPFDVDALTLSTQKLALITRNGAQAEQTVLDLGKALAAAGRGTAELNRMATNLQQIGTNAYVSARDIREFGNAGIDIISIVGKYSEAFKKTGKDTTQVMEWLQSIGDPYTVITNALHVAASEEGEFSEIYTKGMTTMKQVTENMSDAIGIFSYRVLEQSSAIKVAKSAMMKFTELFTDDTFAANAAAALSKLVDVINDLNIVEPIIEGIKNVVAAFANGQFDNAIVFFQNLFKAISQFSGFQVIANGFKVIFDLFSNNHTAEEVAKVATQIGNVIKALLEFKMAMKIGTYFSNLASFVYQLGQGFVWLKNTILTASSASAIFNKTSILMVSTLAAVVVALSAITASSPSEFFENLVSGFQNALSGIADIVDDFFSVGWNLIAGLWNGIKDALDEVFSKIGEAAEQIVNAFKSAFGIHSPSTRMRDEIGQYIDLGIAEGIRVYYGSIASAATEVLEELVDMQSDYVKELSDFGALDLVQQVAVYKDFAALYSRGTKARLEMDEKVHDAETSITKEIISLVETYNKEFDKAMTSAKDYYDMFEYTQTTLTRTTASVIEGLKRQNYNMTQYYQNLKAMSEMGFDADFLSYVADQGMDAASEVAGLAEATKEEIEEINKLWETRGQVATDIAALNTKELKDETLEEIEYLQTGLETKVVNVYDTGTLLVTEFTRGIYDAMPTIEEAMAAVAAKTTTTTQQDTGEEEFQIELGDISQLTSALKDMEIEAFDTADIFSLIKNILSGIPWYAWAAGAGILVTNIASGLKKAKQTAKITDNLANLGDLLGNVGNTATKTGKEIANAAKSCEGQVSQAVKDSLAEKTTINKTWQDDTIKSLNDTHAQTVTKLNNAANTVTTFFNNITSVIKGILKNLRDVIGTTIKELVGTVLDIVRNVLTEILDFITKSFSSILKAVRSLVKDVFKLIESLAKDVGSLISNLFKTILSTVEKMVKSLAKTLEELVPSIKSILDSVTKIVKSAIKDISDILTQVVKGASKILKALGKGIGEAIQAVIKPLSDTKLLVGAGVLVMIATALLEMAVAVQIFSGVSVDAVLNLTVFAAALYVMALAVSSLSSVALQAVAGAVAIAAVGAALAIAAAAIGLASQAVDSINYGNLALLSLCLGLAAVIMGIIGNFALYVGLGAIATMAIGAGLAVAALCLGVASQAVDSINYGNLALLELCVGLAGVIMGIMGPFAGFIGLGAIATMAIGAGLAVAAVCLGVASQAVDSINYGNLALLELDIGLAAIILGIIGTFGKFAAIGAVVSVVIGAGLLVAAVCLASASESAANINEDNLKKLEKCLSIAAVIMGIIGGFGIFAAIGGIASMVFSAGLLVSAICLAEACKYSDNIDIEKLWDIEAALSVAAAIMGIIGTFGKFAAIGGLASMVISGGLLVSAIALEEACKHADGIDIDKLWEIEEAIAVLDVIMAACLLPALMGAPAALATAAIALSVEQIVDSVYNIVEKLNNIDGALKKGETAKSKMYDAIELVLQIAKFEDEEGHSLNLEKDGLFKSAYEDLKNGVSNLAEVAKSIEAILDSVRNIVEKLKEIDSVVKEGETATDMMGEAINLVIQIAKFEDGEGNAISIEKDGLFKDAYEDLKNAISNLAEVAKSVDAIISSVKSLVENLAATQKELPDDKTVEDYIASAINIVKIIAEFKDSEGQTLKTKEGWFSTAYEDLKKAVENVKGIAESVSSVMTAVKNTVTILREFESNNISVEEVETYVADANTIVQKFAEIEVTQSDLDKTATATGNIKTMATNVADILEQTKKIVDNMKNFVGENKENFEHIISEDENTGYISMINKMLAALGRLSASNETENAYSNLASNLGSLSTAVTNVTTILDGVQKMVEAVDDYVKNVDVSAVDGKIDTINEMLAIIVGGTSGKEGATEHTGIHLPEGKTFEESTATQLGYISTALDKIKEIAQKVQSVPDVSDSLSGVESVVKFISDTMSKIPDAIGSYVDELKLTGKEYAEAFKEGWESVYDDIAKAGEALQGELWGAIDKKMQDEQDQGAALAGKVLSGIDSKKSDFVTAGQNLQGEFWGAIEKKMQDEYNQGAALAGKVLSGITDSKSSFEEAGRATAKGFSDGINNNVYLINQSVGNLSNAAISKLKTLLGIHSPSRVMAGLGANVAEGFAEGIEDGLKDVEEAGEKLAESVMEGYESTISPIDLTAFEARSAANAEGVGTGGTTNNRSTTINQYNNIYDNMDMSKALNELTWSVSRA